MANIKLKIDNKEANSKLNETKKRIIDFEKVATSSIDSVKTASRGIVTAFKKVAVGIKTTSNVLKKSFKAVTSVIFNMKSALLALSGAAVLGGMLALVNSISDLRKQALVFGQSATEINAFRYAAESGGQSLQIVSDVSKDLTKNLQKIREQGTVNAVAGFAELGFTLEDVNKVYGNSSSAMQLLESKLDAVNNSSDKVALSMLVAGENGRNLIPIIDGTGNAFAEAEKSVKAYGLVLTDKQFKAVDDVAQSVYDLSQQVKGFFVQSVGALSPALLAAVDQMKKYIANFIDSKGGVKQAALAMTNYFISAIQHVLEGFQDFTIGVNRFVNSVISAFNSIPFVDDVANIDLHVNTESAVSKLEEFKAKITEFASTPVSATASTNTFTSTSTPSAIKLVDESEIEAVRSSLLTQEQSIQESFERRVQMLINARDQGLINEQRFDELQIGLALKTQDELTKIQTDADAQRLSLKKASFSETLNSTTGFLNNLATAVGQGGKKKFEQAKKFKKAAAIVSGIEAAVHSYAAGAKIGGPILGGIFAAASVAATGAQIKAISSASYSGGGGVSPGVSNLNNTDSLAPAQQIERQSSQSIQIQFVGNVMTEQFVEENVVSVIQDLVNNNDVELISSDSRQAQTIKEA